MSKPFKGLAFCCTSIPVKLREEISQKLISMGGTYYSDLMSDVNYLIVGDRKTDKYNFCIKHRHDIKFLKPEAIISVYQLWLEGEESRDLLDINNYLLPIFSGLVVCMSRISFADKSLHDLIFQEDFRSNEFREIVSGTGGGGIGHLDIYKADLLGKYIEANGGKVTESLTMSNSCVITTEKVGKRYTKAVEWNIPVIHPVWVYDSMLRQSALNLEDYSIDQDSRSYSNGCMVWQKLIKPQKWNTRVSEAKPKGSEGADLTIKPTLSRNPTIWNSIMGQTNNSTKKNTEENLWEENENPERADDEDEDDILGFSTAASTTATALSDSAKSHILLGLNFLVLGFSTSQSAVLDKVIQSHGGEVTVDNTDSSITHVIIPSTSGSESSSILKTLPSALKVKINKANVQVVTEWFIERSAYYQKSTLDHWGKPIRGFINPTSRKAASDSKESNTDSHPLKICITGFTGIELLHIQKLITYMGFEFCESLNSGRDLMIVNINLFKDSIAKKSPKLLQYKFKDIIDCPVYSGGVSFVSSRNKINAAKNWGVPIVSIAYLWEALELTTKKMTPTMPDILDLRWCIFVPKGHTKTTSLMDYMRNETSPTKTVRTSANKDKNEEEADSTPSGIIPTSESSVPQLPSPRKGSKQKFGRIVGRSPQRNKMSSSPSKSDGQSQLQDLTFEEEETGVGYASELVELPNPKRRRTAAKK